MLVPPLSVQRDLDGNSMVNDSKQNLNEQYYETLTAVASETIVHEIPKLDIPSVTKILNVTMSTQSKIALEKWKQKMIEKLGEDGFNKYSRGISKIVTKLFCCITALCAQTLIIKNCIIFYLSFCTHAFFLQYLKYLEFLNTYLWTLQVCHHIILEHTQYLPISAHA